jgi:hypothetical protein
MEIPFAFARVSLDAMPASPTRAHAARVTARSASASARSGDGGAAGPDAPPTGDAASDSILTPRARALCAAHCSPSYDSLLPLIPLVQRFADDRLGTQYLQDFFATLIAGESTSPYLQVTASDVRRRAASYCAASALSALAVGVATSGGRGRFRGGAQYGDASAAGRGVARAASGERRGDAVDLGELSRASARLRRALPGQLEAMTLEVRSSFLLFAALYSFVDSFYSFVCSFF